MPMVRPEQGRNVRPPSVRIDRKTLGALGEEATVRHLLLRGFRIMERNWRCRLGELDLVAMDGEQLVFVEVRTRASDAFGTGAESVDERKRLKLRQLAQAYMREKQWTLDLSVRFDVVSVRLLGPDRYEIDHIVHAF